MEERRKTRILVEIQVARLRLVLLLLDYNNLLAYCHYNTGRGSVPKIRTKYSCPDLCQHHSSCSRMEKIFVCAFNVYI